LMYPFVSGGGWVSSACVITTPLASVTGPIIRAAPVLALSLPPKARVMAGGWNCEVAVQLADCETGISVLVPVGAKTWTVLPGDAVAPAVGSVRTTFPAMADGLTQDA